MSDNEKQSILHGIMAAVSMFKHINAPMMSLDEWAICIAGYADVLAQAWGINRDTASLDSIIKELDQVSIPATVLHSEVRGRPEHNN
jgi:hypothetical protein